MFDLTVITWTIEPSTTNVSPLLAIIGPVVPAIVAIVTDPSIPSNAPVPILVVTIQFNKMK